MNMVKAWRRAFLASFLAVVAACGYRAHSYTYRGVCVAQLLCLLEYSKRLFVLPSVMLTNLQNLDSIFPRAVSWLTYVAEMIEAGAFTITKASVQDGKNRNMSLLATTRGAASGGMVLRQKSDTVTIKTTPDKEMCQWQHYTRYEVRLKAVSWLVGSLS